MKFQIPEEKWTSQKLPKIKGMEGIQSIKDASCKEFLISGNYKIGEQCLQYSEGQMASKVEFETQSNHQPMWQKYRTIFKHGNPPAQDPLLLCNQTHHESLNNLCTFSFCICFPPPHFKWHLPFQTGLAQVTGTLSPHKGAILCILQIPPSTTECAMHYLLNKNYWKALMD